MRRCNQVFMDKQCPLINFGLILGMSTLLNSPNQGGHCEMGKVMNPSRKYCKRHNGPYHCIECFNSTLTINNSKLKLLCYHSRFSSILAKKTNFRTGCELPHMKLNVQTIGLKPHPTLTTVGIFKTENYFSSCLQPEKAKAQGHLLSERSLQWVKVRLLG